MARALKFDKFAGLAHDISVGADGSLWVIGTNRVGNSGDCGAYGWDGRNWADLGGGGVRIAGGPDGSVWVVNTAGQIYVRQGGRWNGPLPGGAIDIAVGTQGDVWIVGNNQVGNGGDFGAYRWNGQNWENLGGAGVRIACSADGSAWLLNSAGEVYVCQSTGWTGPLPGLGIDIAAGGDGSLWMLGTNRVGKGNDGGIYRWNGNDWEQIGGGGVNISVGADGTPWVTNSVGEIYHGH